LPEGKRTTTAPIDEDGVLMRAIRRRALRRPCHWSGHRRGFLGKLSFDEQGRGDQEGGHVLRLGEGREGLRILIEAGDKTLSNTRRIIDERKARGGRILPVTGSKIIGMPSP